MKQKLAGALAFAQHEAASGLVLVAAAALALVFSNSGLSFLYDAFLHTPVVVQVGALKLDKPLLLWINDGLMAIFFFLVGLEIKRELLAGELSSLDEGGAARRSPRPAAWRSRRSSMCSSISAIRRRWRGGRFRRRPT